MLDYTLNAKPCALPMPELPEVETVCRQLNARLCGQRLVSVHLLRSGREFPVGKKFEQALAGKKIVKIARRAKLIIWYFDDGTALIAHLKMTGRFVFVNETYIPQKHDRAVFLFTAPSSSSLRGVRDEAIPLVWSDIRQFGFIKLLSLEELKFVLSKYGPEPLETSEEKLADRLRPKTIPRPSLKRRGSRTVKAALLDQTVIAGVGNIYADEACHRAGLRPTRRLQILSAADRLRLVKELKTILAESITQKGTSANDYVDTSGKRGGFLNLLRVYGHEGQPCQTCGTLIKKIVLAQRGTHYCPNCQK